MLGKRITRQLVIITTDLHTARLGGSSEKPQWFERRTNKRLHASTDARSWYLHILSELSSQGDCFVFTGCCKTALSLPSIIGKMAEAMNMTVASVITSPKAIPIQISESLNTTPRWGSVLLSEIPDPRD